MDVKYINSFIQALSGGLSEYGVIDMKIGKLRKKESMNFRNEVNAIFGIAGKIVGNAVYSFSLETATWLLENRNVAAGSNPNDHDVRKEIGTFVRGIVSHFHTGVFEESGGTLAQPYTIFGEELYLQISSVQMLIVEMETAAGTIEISFGLEM